MPEISERSTEPAAAETPLMQALGEDRSPEALLDAFAAYCERIGLPMYPHQEEAALEFLSGNHVILATPTGSGKSLVAQLACFAALATGGRAVYTAPIKALVSEKFFDLCRAFGASNVGMVTGDAAVNPEAPVICATAEILANRVLRHGPATAVDVVVMDEFHYYADTQRGWAWQVPLLELRDTGFLLMSATLGPTAIIEEDLRRRTGRPVAVVDAVTRPVPLSFEYRDTPVHETIGDLLDGDRAPVYLVHFTQKAAAETAGNLTSLDVLTKAEKARLWELVGSFRFDTPVGRHIKRFIGHGVGLHHAGLLPKYRLLIEKLAQEGLLKLICGTDTLGVGVNIPIRTVLFTQLCKYDGTTTRLLSNREFAQIAGRAGRKGFDDEGFVVAQAPAHEIENRRMVEKAEASGRSKAKVVKRKAPERGFVPWTAESFQRISTGRPEPLTSTFRVTHQMVLEVLDRPGDGRAALRALIEAAHEGPDRTAALLEQAAAIETSMIEAGVIEELDAPDERGRTVRVNIDLQDEFALHQPLSLFAMELVEALAGDAEAGVDEATHALDILSVIESVLENPGAVLAAQTDRERGEAVARMKAEGIEYEERMARLTEVTHPRPLAEVVWAAFRTFAEHHPWVGEDRPRPKSVTRELYETGYSFGDYVNHLSLSRSEGLLLRYLSDTYKALLQTVPDAQRTEALWDLIEWLGETVRQVDSSLIDEWERLQQGEVPSAADAGRREAADRDVTANERAFRVMVRNECRRWVRSLAARDWAAFDGVPDGSGRSWSPARFEEAAARYFVEHDWVSPDFTLFRQDGDTVHQTVVDPEGWNEWVLVGTVDREASRDAGRAVVALTALTTTASP